METCGAKGPKGFKCQKEVHDTSENHEGKDPVTESTRIWGGYLANEHRLTWRSS